MPPLSCVHAYAYLGGLLCYFNSFPTQPSSYIYLVERNAHMNLVFTYSDQRPVAVGLSLTPQIGWVSRFKYFIATESGLK